MPLERRRLTTEDIATLKKFYGVETTDELIAVQNDHIERLQNKLSALDKTFRGNTIVREG